MSEHHHQDPRTGELFPCSDPHCPEDTPAERLARAGAAVGKAAAALLATIGDAEMKEEWQGFSNQETWLAWLWVRESLVARHIAISEGAEALREWTMAEVPDNLRDSMLDFVRAALDRVDYDELTAHLLEEK